MCVCVCVCVSYLCHVCQSLDLSFKNSPDVILCGWLGSKHQLTNFPLTHTHTHKVSTPTDTIKLPCTPIPPQRENINEVWGDGGQYGIQHSKNHGLHISNSPWCLRFKLHCLIQRGHELHVFTHESNSMVYANQNPPIQACGKKEDTNLFQRVWLELNKWIYVSWMIFPLEARNYVQF